MVNDRSQTTYFLHADGDSFFAACELTLRPDLVGKPVVVGEDRGIAVAMSHEAKALGVTRGMPVFKIRKYFPSVVILPHHFSVYRAISDEVYGILLSYLEFVERYSIDECFALVKPAEILFAGGALELLRAIQDEIRQKTGVTYSLGLARTKALAKTASKLDKPNGAVALLTPKDEQEALRRTSIADVWGIGWRTVPRMQELGFRTAWDFTCYPEEEISRRFSEPVAVLQRELSGHAVHEVHYDNDPRDQKSVQSTGTFRPSSSDPKVIWAEISENAESACSHARRLGLMTRSVSFFVKTSEWQYRGGEARLELFTTDPAVILNALESVFLEVLRPGEKIRSTGIILHELRREEDVPHDLFGRQDRADSFSTVGKAVDAIRDKFGSGALKLAASLKGSGKESDNSFPHGF